MVGTPPACCTPEACVPTSCTPEACVPSSMRTRTSPTPPKVSTSQSESSARAVTGLPLIHVPFDEPQSERLKRPSKFSMSAWRRERLVSSITRSFSGVRPIEKRLVSTSIVWFPKVGGSVSVRRDDIVKKAVIHSELYLLRLHLISMIYA